MAAALLVLAALLSSLTLIRGVRADLLRETAGMTAVTQTAGSDDTAAAIVRCSNLVQIYGDEGQQVTALRGVDLTVSRGRDGRAAGPVRRGQVHLALAAGGPAPADGGPGRGVRNAARRA